VDIDAPLQWSATGPVEDQVLLALDSPETVPTEPLDGPTTLNQCLVHGSFPMQAHTGSHTVTLFVLGPDGHVVSRLSKAITVR
jgi:hypothetical protein